MNLLSIFKFTVFCAWFVLSFSVTSEGQENLRSSKDFENIKGEIIVVLNEGKNLSDIDDLNEAYGVDNIELISRPMNIYLLKASKDSSSEAMAVEYQKNPAVRSADPNYLLKEVIPFSSSNEECESCKKKGDR